MKKLLLALFILLCAQELKAATRYISPTGTGSAPCTNPADPCPKTTGEGQVVSGDTLELQNGNYGTVQIGPLPAGTAGSRTIIQAAAGATVTVHVVVLDNFQTIQRGLGTAFIVDHQFSSTAPQPWPITHQFDLWKEATVDGLEIKDARGAGGIFAQTDTTNSNVVIKNNKIHRIGWNGTSSNCQAGDPPGPGFCHGLYIASGSGVVVENNEILDIDGYGVHACSGFVGITVRGNVIHDAGSFGIGACGPNITAHDNIVYNNGLRCTGCAGIIAYSGTSPGNTLHNNTLYANDIGIHCRDAACTAKNNLIISNPDGTIQCDPGGCTTQNNVTTGSAASHFVNAAGANFNLIAGSSAIDGGTTSGLTIAYNGVAPDVGAHEAPIFASASVESGDASTVRVNLTNNRSPPSLPASACTGFSVTVNSVNRTINSCTRNGTNRFDLALASAVVSGDVVKVSYSSSTGNVTDSAAIGSSLWANKNGTMRSFTDQTVTNNVTGSSATFTQTYARFRNLRGSESAAPWKTLNANEHYTIMSPGDVRVRIKVACTVLDCPASGFAIYVSQNGGAYALVPDSCTSSDICMYGNSGSIGVSNGEATTEQLTSDHPNNVAGGIIRTQAAVPSIDLPLNGEAENEYALTVKSGVTLKTTFQFELRRDGNVALNGYNFRPMLTVVNPQMIRQ